MKLKANTQFQIKETIQNTKRVIYTEQVFPLILHFNPKTRMKNSKFTKIKEPNNDSTKHFCSFEHSNISLAYCSHCKSENTK